MDKIIEAFLNNPEREYHVREIAKLTKKSPTTISKILKNYEKKDILISENKLNHLFFKANSQNKNYKELKRHYNLKKINESGIIQYLETEFNHPEAIILFGSFAKAENIPQSDIDILIITPTKKEINLQKFEQKLTHTIQLHTYSTKEIDVMKTKNKPLLNTFINGITISGQWEIFK